MERISFLISASAQTNPYDLVLCSETERWQEVSRVTRLAVHSLSAFLTQAFVVNIIVKYQRAEPKRRRPCNVRQ